MCSRSLGINGELRVQGSAGVHRDPFLLLTHIFITNHSFTLTFESESTDSLTFVIFRHHIGRSQIKNSELQVGITTASFLEVFLPYETLMSVCGWLVGWLVCLLVGWLNGLCV